jgi:DNA-binding MarR family transcriptional regulator
MDGRLPLPALLSHALVAFTIEFDNEFEHRMPHRTSHGPAPGSRGGPWLTSMAMWSTCMRFVPEEGIPVRQLEEAARTKTNLNGMERWGYVTVAPDPAGRQAKSPPSQWLIRPTPKGRQAQQIWEVLFDVVENRWRERFGKDQIGHLREALWAVARQIDADLPDCMPILGYGLVCQRPERKRRESVERAQENLSSLSLPTLLSRVLLAFAVEFEGESEVSLAIGANVLRLAGDDGLRVRDLPRMAAVSKEAIAMALSFLSKRGYASIRLESAGSRVKVLWLTPKGRQARDAYGRLVGAIEERWQEKYGKHSVDTLRESLERLTGGPGTQLSPLFGGLEPYPEGWRASLPKPAELPHFPMVLHRGGFPDGS